MDIQMAYRRSIVRSALLAMLVLIPALVAGCTRVPGVYVAEKRGGASASANGGAFDAKTYADGIWDSKVVPTVTDKAVDAPTLLAALKADAAGAAKQYGKPSGSTYAYLIKGSGTVLALDDAGGPGKLEIDLSPADGKPDLLLAVGPVFVGTALRDAVGFIDFNQFTNQVDYANAATALNAEVRSKVVNGLDVNGAKSKTVTFAGAFQLLDPNNILVTPAKLEVS
jgi:predicted lipoprotein